MCGSLMFMRLILGFAAHFKSDCGRGFCGLAGGSAQRRAGNYAPSRLDRNAALACSWFAIRWRKAD
jgi:hypothetical protein